MGDVFERIDRFIADCNRDPAYSGSWHAGLELNEIKQQWEKERPAYEFPVMKQCYEKDKYVVGSLSIPRNVLSFPQRKAAEKLHEIKEVRPSITISSLAFWLLSATAMVWGYFHGSVSLLNSTSFLLLLCVLAAILADRPVNIIVLAGGFFGFELGIVASPYHGVNAPRLLVICGFLSLGVLWIWLTIMCISTKSVFQSFKEIMHKRA